MLNNRLRGVAQLARKDQLATQNESRGNVGPDDNSNQLLARILISLVWRYMHMRRRLLVPSWIAILLLMGPAQNALSFAFFGVDPPLPPGTGYSLPLFGLPPIYVRNTAELQAAVDEDQARDIFIEPGEPGAYSTDGLTPHPILYPTQPDFKYLELLTRHRLWALFPMEVTLQFGIRIRADGAELHGLVFNISEELHGAQAGTSDFETSAIQVEAQHVLIEDCRIYGNGVIHNGIRVHDSVDWSVTNANGFEMHRVEIYDVKRFGVYVWHEELVNPRIGIWLTDLNIVGVRDPNWVAAPYMFSAGTQEHGLTIGETGVIERVRTRDTAVAGIATTYVDGLELYSIDIDDVVPTTPPVHQTGAWLWCNF